MTKNNSSKKSEYKPGKPLLKSLSHQELEDYFISLAEPKFRALQTFQQIYSNKVQSISGLTNLSVKLREKLTEDFEFSAFTKETVRHSADGTIKILFELADGAKIETVLIPAEFLDKPKRLTICVSSQAGCAYNCAFCATGKLGFKRNLETGEIVEQFLRAEQIAGERISNIVFMGMGEPLLNYDNVVKAIKNLTNEKTGLLSPRRITVSTVGVEPKIRQLAYEKLNVKLAFSLHATTNSKRQKLIGSPAEKWSISEIGDALEFFYRITNIPITFEYILLDGVNNSEDDAKRLAKLAKRVPTKINIIPFHDISFVGKKQSGIELKPCDDETIDKFVRKLWDLGAKAFVRTSSGADIEAACGQLALSSQKEK